MRLFHSQLHAGLARRFLLVQRMFVPANRVLYAIALAHYALVYARAWAADSINARVRLSAENDRLQEECALLREELRIKDTSTAQIATQ